MSNRVVSACLVMLAGLGACSGAERAPSEASMGKESPSAGAAAPTVNLTGRAIAVELYSDGRAITSNRQRSRRIAGISSASRSKAACTMCTFCRIHPGAQGLPPASEFLQLHDQTWDFV